MAGPVVVGVDGTDAASRAVRWAAVHAVRHGTGLRLVHAVERTSPGATEVLRAAGDVAAAAGVPATVTTGDVLPGEVLVRESAEASLVVLGARGHRGFSGRLIGATVATVAARAQCPMVVMGESECGEGPVVVGVDGTPTSDAAVVFALREAALRGTDLVAVHGLAVGFGTAVLDADRADEVIATLLARQGERFPEVKVTRQIVPATPGAALLDHATGAQLVVVGGRRRIGHHGRVLRSTGEQLLHHAPCPVAMVRWDHSS